jgi:predicted nucleic acid-binding Zn ribbon protein
MKARASSTRSAPSTIGSAIARVLDQFGLSQKVRQYNVVDCWAQVVGEQIAKVTVAEKIADGKLYVTVANPVWRNELVFLKKDLIAKLNHAMAQDVVHDIVFK